MTGRLIDADELLKHKSDHETISTHLIWNAPTVDAIPVAWLKKYAEEHRSSLEEFRYMFMDWAMEKAQTVDAEPVRHGEWIITTGKYFGEEVICCSVCGGCKWTLAPYEGLVRSFKYCPNCGAKMDGCN